ncbi:hypothetical protein DICPUDRAFT_75959 [Dictyostelium purpureum]|uniref:Monalysin Pore-forming domain-containing protein n=1 Tax=Dictyostelium purpureum TaxID=5786 RepID=F0ZC60_DICPU|nr:uncharacterized protein DICPUDRAFT_75959 [Dictyostelium purpureum]EGC38439.1 hypothetical protein DICPUDRAFT_75959 [Dictyostelium purpureum]|eukprot:XP_003284997.1 hypothetical protein DICPUDRAFT_75959 [Dictyostelium purpureum]
MALDTAVNSQITDAVDDAQQTSVVDKSWSIPKSSTVKTNYQIDKHLKLLTNPESMVFIDSEDKSESSTISVGKLKLPVQIKPVAALRSFISSQTVVGTQEHELTKKKGYSTTFTASTSLKSSISGGIGECEASFEVTTEFSYSQNSYEEKSETWTTTLTEGSYTLYQNILLYAFKVDAAADPAIRDVFTKDSPDLTFYQRPNTQEWYLFVPTYMNSPFTISFSSDTYDPVSEDDVISYLMNNGYSKWCKF